MSDAVEAFRSRSESPPDRQLPIDGNQIIVKNESTDDLDAGTVLVVTANSLLTAVDRDFPWTTADILRTSNTHLPLCVLLEPLIEDKIRPAAIAGVAVASIDVGATTHRFAYPDGAAGMVSGTFGPFQILSNLTETGVQNVWCLVGQVWPTIRGRLAGDLLSGCTATMHVWDSAYGVAPAATGEDVTITDYQPSSIAASKKILSSSPVSARWIGYAWHFEVAGTDAVNQ